MHSLILRITGKVRRTLATQFCQKRVPIKISRPIISFTFDDAPKSAFDTGGAILGAYGAKATFFMSLSLLNSETEVGIIASADDLLCAIKEGHELGCHTYDHLDAWYTSTDQYMNSVLENRRALKTLLPEAKFTTFAYPKSGATYSVKPHLQKLFTCCRGGGQAPNVDVLDLNLLKACFLDKRTHIDMEDVKKLIDYNASRRGLLVFVTHDVADDPSPYGCTPDFFRQVVEYSVISDALLLPLGEACENLLASSSA